jgi:uncharacterized protein YegP (UPF0339 family)
MQFVIVKKREPVKGIRYHAQLYNDEGKLIFWTKLYKTEAKAIQRCEEAQDGAAKADIVLADSPS